VKHRRFRERRISSITDNGIESIMSDDYSFSDDLDPAYYIFDLMIIYFGF
jgi:hypothetical protein